jgi:SAM-dependent methyltransferase
MTTQLLHVAAALRIADALAGAPASAAELAGVVGARSGPLHRVLRGLAAEQVVDELPDGRFALTPLGELLRDGVPGSMRRAAIARGGLYYGMFKGLLDAVRDGGTAFERVHGETFFEYLAAHPADRAVFQASMVDRSAREAAGVVACCDFTRFRRVVDVGGGPGVLLRAVLAAAPDVEGLLFDRPEVVRDATLPAQGGDFFVAVPEGADAYLLSRVLHDWADEDALRILRTCRRAMAPGSTLLIVDAVLPERAVDDPAAVRMDLLMLALLDGRERTLVEFAALLAAGEFALVTATPTDTGMHVLEAVPK